MRGVALLALVVSLSSPAWAQDSAPAPAAQADSQIDATKLGVSLARIQKGLRVTESREKQKQPGAALRLEFQVQVYGTAPRIEVLKGIDLFNGPVPGSAPTHRQFIDFVTPQIYRTPGLPISALAGWAATQLWQKSKKSKCEEEIEAYRAMLMQGISVSAPRCTQ
ncbi:MAG: hypothetical protein WC815_15495 [Vicinamibacterales bacterium]|jgi:hypothetical protein